MIDLLCMASNGLNTQNWAARYHLFLQRVHSVSPAYARTSNTAARLSALAWTAWHDGAARGQEGKTSVGCRGQYAGEKEITFPPFTCLEADGDPRVEHTEDGEIVVFPLKVQPAFSYIPFAPESDDPRQWRDPPIPPRLSHTHVHTHNNHLLSRILVADV